MLTLLYIINGKKAKHLIFQATKKRGLKHSFLKSMPPPISPILSPYYSASSPPRYSDESLLRLLAGERREAG